MATVCVMLNRFRSLSLHQLLAFSILFSAAVVLVRAIFLSNPELNWDVALYLQIGRWILDGRVPYRDFWETNPPLIMYLNVIPVHFSDITGLSLQTSCNLLLGAMVTFGSFVVFRRAKDTAVFLLSYWLSVWISIKLGVFGERDQVFSLMFFPYIVARVDSAPRRSAANFLIFFLCSLTACLKPAFLLMLGVCELQMFFQGKKLNRPQTLALLAPIFLYGILFTLLPDAAVKDFWFNHVPLFVRRYSTFDSPWANMWLQWRNYLLSLPIILGLLWMPRSRDFDLNPLRRALAVLLPLAIALALGSQKAWAYHYAITNALSALAIALVWQSGKTYASRILAGAMMTVLVFAAFHSWDQGPLSAARQQAYKNRASKFDYCRSGDSVVVFSADPFFIYPMVLEKNLVWASRYVQMYPIVFFSHAKTDAHERLFINRIKEDLERNQPTVLIFPKGEGYLAQDIETLDYAKKVGWYDFIESHYDLVANDQANAIYRLRTD